MQLIQYSINFHEKNEIKTSETYDSQWKVLRDMDLGKIVEFKM